MVKSLSVALTALLLLSGCSSAPSNPEEEAFKSWTENVYEYKELKYASNSDMKREAFYEVKPVLDELALALGENKMKVDTSIFNDDDWFLKQCKEFKSESQMPRLEPLEDPLVGFKDGIDIVGYVEPKALLEAAEGLGFSSSKTEGDKDILWGSNTKYDYKTYKYTYKKETEHFTFEIEQDTAWNALLWEQYVTVEDPGNYDSAVPMPDDKFAPFTIRIYFKSSCELVKPELSDFFNFLD